MEKNHTDVSFYNNHSTFNYWTVTKNMSLDTYNKNLVKFQKLRSNSDA